MLGRNLKYIIIGLSIISALFLVVIVISKPGKDVPENQERNGLFEALTTKKTGNVRKFAFAGSFYPKERGELEKQINSLLEGAEKIIKQGKPRIVIVPHAGIDYSGNAAAHGFKQLEGENYSRVIVLGASHTVAFEHVAVYGDGFWETPLGKVEVDEEYFRQLINGTSILEDKEPHIKEHSLEMEVIFLQQVLDDFKIVPILVSNPTDGVIGLLAQKIAYSFDDETLLVVSTDLSHYPKWSDAKKADKEIIDAILTLDRKTFEKTVSDVEVAGYDQMDTSACGQDAVRVALSAANNIGIDEIEKIYYENSGDVTGEKGGVVGYAAIVGYSDEIVHVRYELDEVAQKEALNIARQTLENYLRFGKKPSVITSSEVLSEPLGVFVTLESDNQLRGCIGTFEPSRHLYQVIQDTAIISATKDARFMPVSASELEKIDIEISIMTPKRKIDNWQNIRIGEEGVVMQKGEKSGTFLPQVATDNGWDLTTFLDELCAQKIGLQKGCYKDSSAEIYTFEVQVFAERD